MSELIFGPEETWGTNPDADTDEPAYRRIAKYYQRKIIRGELPDGSKLPSAREMCELHRVSDITARAAVNLLQEWGLVVGVRGKGQFVRRPHKGKRTVPERYWRHESTGAARTYVREAERAELPLEVQHHSRKGKAPAAIGRRLGIGTADPVMITRYLITMGGQPVTSSTSYEPLALTRGTPIEWPHEGPLGQQGIVPRFDSIGIRINRVEEAVRVRFPTVAEAKTLEMPRSQPVIEIEQTFRRVQEGSEDVVPETADIVFPADRYELEYKMEVR